MKKSEAAKSLKQVAALLRVFRTQLFARHEAEPLKSPPIFALEVATMRVDEIAKQLGKKGK